MIEFKQGSRDLRCNLRVKKNEWNVLKEDKKISPRPSENQSQIIAW